MTVIRKSRQDDKKTIWALRRIVLAFVTVHIIILLILARTFFAHLF